MTHNLTASQARTVSSTDQIVYNEVDTINRAIYVAGLAGDLSTEVGTGTDMTNSTPTVTVTSAGYADGWTPAGTFTIAGTTITLSSGVNDGVNIAQATADINAAGITGLTATNDGSEITLTYVSPQGTWSLALAEGSGSLAELGFTAGSTSATIPESVDYYAVWSGTTEDRKKTYAMAQVIQHFQDLGYNILRKQNTGSAQSTLKWEVYW